MPVARVTVRLFLICTSGEEAIGMDWENGNLANAVLIGVFGHGCVLGN